MPYDLSSHRCLAPINGARSGFHIVEQELTPTRNGLIHDVCIPVAPMGLACCAGHDCSSRGSQLGDVDERTFQY